MSLRGSRLAFVLAFSPGLAAAQSPPWIADGDLPLPAGMKSVEVVHADEPLQVSPEPNAARRGAAQLGVHLPVYAALRRSGCTGRWLMVGPLAWLCEANVRWSPSEPIAPVAIDTSAASDLPYRYYFVGSDGSLGYATLAFAEEGVPDLELEPGFAVGVSRIEERGPGDFFGLTAHGLWVPMRDFSPARPSAFRGVELTDGQSIGWVFSTDARLRASPSGPVRGSVLSRLEAVTILETRRLGARIWYRVTPDGWLSDRELRVVQPAPAPESVGRFEHWIDVDSSAQVLTLYDGSTPVFATVVSTGKGTGKSSEATPLGEHRIWVKLQSQDMDNLEDESASRYYAMQSVPWVMFFQKGYGLHGTYWHDSFGTRRSHGCVNLSPADAARVFAWTHPRLPAGWSAAFPTAYEPGTLIRIR